MAITKFLTYITSKKYRPTKQFPTQYGNLKFYSLYTINSIQVNRDIDILLPCGKNFAYISLKVSSCTIPPGHSWKWEEIWYMLKKRNVLFRAYIEDIKYCNHFPIYHLEGKGNQCWYHYLLLFFNNNFP